MSEAMQALREGITTREVVIDDDGVRFAGDQLNPKAKLDAAIDSAILEFMDSSGQKVLSIVINGDIDPSNGQYIVSLESV